MPPSREFRRILREASGGRELSLRGFQSVQGPNISSINIPRPVGGILAFESDEDMSARLVTKARAKERAEVSKSNINFRQDVFLQANKQRHGLELEVLKQGHAIEKDILDDIQLRQKENREVIRTKEEEFDKLQTDEAQNLIRKHTESVQSQLKKKQEEFLQGGDESLAQDIGNLIDLKNVSLKKVQQHIESMGRENLAARKGKIKFDEDTRAKAFELNKKLLDFQQKGVLEEFKQNSIIERQKTLEQLKQENKLDIKEFERETKKLAIEAKELIRQKIQEEKGIIPVNTLGELRISLVKRKGQIAGDLAFDAILSTLGFKQMNDLSDAELQTVFSKSIRGLDIQATAIEKIGTNAERPAPIKTDLRSIY